MQAELIFELRELLSDGCIMTMRIWRVPAPVPPSGHSFKYSLFYGRPGERLVLFDNERGKGDHKHIREVESPYRFRGPERLVEDFIAAIEALRSEAE